MIKLLTLKNYFFNLNNKLLILLNNKIITYKINFINPLKYLPLPSHPNLIVNFIISNYFKPMSMTKSYPLTNNSNKKLNHYNKNPSNIKLHFLRITQPPLKLKHSNPYKSPTNNTSTNQTHQHPYT